MGDQLIGATYHGEPLEVIGYDGMEKWLDLVFELLQIAHSYTMTDNLLDAVRNCLRAAKGAGLTIYTLQQTQHPVLMPVLDS